MKSQTVPSFWETYRTMSEDIQQSARKSFRFWEQNPFHPSLRFKCINSEENIWAVRITRGYRALGVLDGDTLTWFWVGSHEKYERFFS